MALEPWLKSYLRTLAEGRVFRDARGVPPAWLASESAGSGDGGGPARLTIQMASELYHRLVVTGPPGAGKTTVLRQLAGGLAEAILAAEDEGMRGQAQRSQASQIPLPVYIELARFAGDVQPTLAAEFGAGAPPLVELGHGRPLLFVLDGLDELAPHAQLPGLAALSRAFASAGPRVRWVCTCAAENLPMFRPWLGSAEVRAIQAMRTRDALALVQQQCGAELSDWLERAGDIATLATRPRWLTALTATAAAGGLTTPLTRGSVLAAWVPAVLRATAEAHGWTARLDDFAGLLPAISAALDQRGQATLPLTEAQALLTQLGAAPGAGAPGPLQALLAADIIALDPNAQQVSFRHPLLRAFGHGALLGDTAPDAWPASVLSQSPADVLLLAYDLAHDRGAVLRRLLNGGAVALAARCLIECETPDRFNALLERSGVLTPALRVTLADTFAAEGRPDTARDQLERAATEGYDEAGVYGRLGDLYAAAEDWRRSRAAFERALEREPHDLRYRQQLGVVCSRLGDLDRASAALEAVLDQQQRRSAQAAFELGLIYEQQSQLDRALAAYRQAMAAMPDSAQFRRSAAAVLRRLGQVDQAEAELTTLLASAGDPASFAELSQLYAETGRAQQAAAAMARAVALAPGDPALYLQLGRMRRSMGDLAGARAALQRAAELSPEDGAIHFELGRLAEAAGEFEGALASYHQAALLDPSSDSVLRALGGLLRARGDDEGAVAALRSALALRPDNPETLLDLADLLWRGGHTDQALDAYRRAVALAPDNADMVHALGLAYRRAGQEREALRHLRAAADRGRDRADLQFDAALSAERLEQWQEALARYDRATTLAPDHPEYARAAAALHIRSGDPRRARELLARALRLRRDDPATLYQVGLLHSRARSWSRAITALQRAASADSAPRYSAALGCALLEAGRVDDACAVFSQALRAHPDDTTLLHHFSQALAARGDSEGAYRAARHAAQLCAGDASLQEGAGALAVQLGRWNEALVMLDHAVALDSTRTRAHLLRAEALMAVDQPAAALGAANTALELDPKLVGARLGAGLALARLGRNGEARAALSEAVERLPHHPAALAALRDVCQALGDVDSALGYARRAAHASASITHVRRLAELLLAAGHGDDARAAFERVLAAERVPAREAAAAHVGLCAINAGAGAWLRARSHAERAVALEPESAERHALLARTLVGGGQPRAAIASYEAAVARAPNRADWLGALGELLRQAGDDAAALPHLRRAAVLEPQSERFYAAAACMRATGDLPAAAQALERALHHRPDEVAWRVELAEIQIARGWLNEAVAELGHALARSPEDADIWRLRGEALMRLRRHEAARADLVQSLRRRPDNAHVYHLLALVLLEQSFTGQALEAARRAVALAPQASEHRRTLARVLRALGRHDEAAGELSGALDDASPAVWWGELAGDWQEQGDLDRAAAAWRRAVEGAPEDAELRYRLGSLLALAGQPAEAAEHLRAAVALRPDFAAAQARLAEVLVRDIAPARADEPVAAKSAADEALEHARQAVAIDARASEHWRALGAALRGRGEIDEAIEALRRATELAPSSAPAALLLGQTLLEAGEHEPAIAALTAAVDADPAAAEPHGWLGTAWLRAAGPPADVLEGGALENERAAGLERARAALSRACELAPGDTRWWQTLGALHQAAGRHGDAIEALDRAIGFARERAAGEPIAHSMPDLRPNAEALRLRARSLYLAGRAAEARGDMEAALAPLSASEHDAEDLYLLGRIAYDQRDMETARARLEGALALSPGHARALQYLGRTLVALGQPAEAVAQLERAADQRPDDAAVAAALSDAYAAAGRRERALVAAARAVRLDSRAAEHHQRLAGMYAESGRLHEARAALINALTLQPAEPAWHAQMGDICVGLGMAGAATSAYAKAAELAPGEPRYRYAMATALNRQGRANDAVEALRAAVRAAPEEGAWRFELARLEQQLGDQTSAREHLAAAAQYAPSTPDHWLALAESQRTAGDAEAAEETLERALLRFSDHAGLHAATGALHEARSEWEQAIWHYAVAAESDAQCAEHWWRLGRARLEAEDSAGARQALERALALDPDAAEAHAAMARIFAAEDDGRAALLHIQRAAELAPDAVLFQVQLAEAYSVMRRFEEARQALERAVRLAPGDAELLARYGETALSVGHNREALQAFERAIDHQPDEPRYYFLAGRAHRRLKHYSRAIERLRRAVKMRPGYSEAIIELSTLGPLAFVAHHLRGEDDDQAAA